MTDEGELSETWRVEIVRENENRVRHILDVCKGLDYRSLTQQTLLKKIFT